MTYATPTYGDWLTVYDADTGEVESTGTFDGYCSLADDCYIVDIYPDYGPNENGYLHTDGAAWRPATLAEIAAHKALPPRQEG